MRRTRSTSAIWAPSPEGALELLQVREERATAECVEGARRPSAAALVEEVKREAVHGAQPRPGLVGRDPRASVQHEHRLPGAMREMEQLDVGLDAPELAIALPGRVERRAKVRASPHGARLVHGATPAPGADESRHDEPRSLPCTHGVLPETCDVQQIGHCSSVRYAADSLAWHGPTRKTSRDGPSLSCPCS
jgi:hypothetical protein